MTINTNSYDVVAVFNTLSYKRKRVPHDQDQFLE